MAAFCRTARAVASARRYRPRRAFFPIFLSRTARPGSDRRRLRWVPRTVRPTGDDTPAAGLPGYVLRMTGWHQLAVCLLASVVAGLGVAPIELQRRLINDAIEGGSLRWLALLAGIYAGVLVCQAVLKLSLRIYQAWLSESAVRYTRGHLARLVDRRRRPAETEGSGPDGETVSIIGREVDKLGGFVGEGPSDAVATVGLLVAILGYMVAVEPRVALACAPFLIPQAILIPLIQRRLNRLTEDRLQRLRDSADEIAAGRSADDLAPGFDGIFRNRMALQAWKFAMKAAVNLLNAAAPLAVLAIGGLLVIRGETSLGVVVAFMTGFDRLAEPMRELLTLYRQAAQASVQHEMVARWM